MPGELHLLVTDVVMPEMNGQELAKKLLAQSSGLKFFFMSNPFSKKEIAVKLREALDAAR